jgi:hypothetical protein
MKKFILFTISVFTVSLFAQSASENMIEFLTLEKEHAAAWTDFKKNLINKKIDIAGQEKSDWLDYAIDEYKALDALTDINQKDSFAEQQLKEATALREKHGQAMNDLWIETNKAGKDLYEKQAAEFKKFKEFLEPKKEDAESPDPEKTEDAEADSVES